MNEIKDYFRNSSTLLLSLFTGFMIGYLFLSIYSSGISEERSEYLRGKENLDQLNLLISQNQDLTDQKNRLSDEIEKMKSSYSANLLIKENINRNELILGQKAIHGSGVTLLINIDIAPYWFIDMINEFYDLGAEIIAVNDIKIDTKTSFLKEIDSSLISINGNTVTPAYNIKIIGNPNILFKGLNNSTGIVNRLKESFPNHENDIQILISNDISIPPNNS